MMIPALEMNIAQTPNNKIILCDMSPSGEGVVWGLHPFLYKVIVITPVCGGAKCEGRRVDISNINIIIGGHVSRRTRPRVNAVSHNTRASNEGSRRF